MFTKEERSSFKYWFAHWCSYQMTALNLKCWKWKYLFHDVEKPWLKLIWGDYPRVQKWHRTHNKHHVEYCELHGKADWEGMVIDWECSRFTKDSAPMTAKETYEYYINKRANDGTVSQHTLSLMTENIPKVLNRLNLKK